MFYMGVGNGVTKTIHIKMIVVITKNEINVIADIFSFRHESSGVSSSRRVEDSSLSNIEFRKRNLPCILNGGRVLIYGLRPKAFS